MNKQNAAFTIVELVVVVTILSILGVIGFASFTSYLSTVRDSTRVVEIENLEAAFSSYILKTGYYPTPTDPVEILYSGVPVWTQGTLGNTVAEQISYSLDTVDPLTKNEYTYSIKNNGKAFQIGGVLENIPEFTFNNGLLGKANANGVTAGTAIVGGDYNGEVLSLLIGGIDYILALPSIISSDITTSTDIVDILNNNDLVIHNYSNLPASYAGTEYNIDANIDFRPNDLVVFSGSITDLKKSYNQVLLLQNLYLAYSGSILGKDIVSNKIDPIELFSGDISSKVKNSACDIVNFKLKYFAECGSIDYITFFVINILHIDISNLPGDIEAVYQDASGNFVFGTDEGLAFYDGTTWVVYDEDNSALVDNEVESITQDNSGNYWIATEKGLNKISGFDFADGGASAVFTTYNKDILLSSHIQYVYTDTNGIVWVGTKKGVNSYNGDIWTDYTKKTIGLTQNKISAIFTDSMSNVWFGTHSKGVDKYNIITEEITNYGKTELGLSNDDVEYIYEDSQNRIWVGTEGGVAMSTNFGDTWTGFTNSNTSGILPDDDVKYIYEDLVGNVWVGTKKGLVKYDTSGVWTAMVLFANEEIFIIYEDEFGNIVVFGAEGVRTIDVDGVLQV